MFKVSVYLQHIINLKWSFFLFAVILEAKPIRAEL